MVAFVKQKAAIDLAGPAPPRQTVQMRRLLAACIAACILPCAILPAGGTLVHMLLAYGHLMPHGCQYCAFGSTEQCAVLRRGSGYLARAAFVTACTDRIASAAPLSALYSGCRSASPHLACAWAKPCDQGMAGEAGASSRDQGQLRRRVQQLREAP